MKLRKRRPAAAALIAASETMTRAMAATEHPDPINMAVGEPAEPLPGFLLDAGTEALKNGRTRYGDPAGAEELRDALAERETKRDGLLRSRKNVVITAGAKPALHDCLRCLLSPGDEVLLLAPFWPTYADQIRLLGAVPVIVPAASGARPDLAALERYTTRSTRALICNSPNNPSGIALSGPEFRSIARLALAQDLWVITDQAYQDLAFDPDRPTLLSAAPELRDHTVVIESFSKRYSMTGLRLGAAIAPSRLVTLMTRLASTATTHPSTLSQAIGLEALRSGDAWLEEQRQRHRRRHDRGYEVLSRIDGVSVARGHAGMFLFPDVTALLKRHGWASDEPLVRTLLESAGLRVVPGTAFGAPGHIRLSYGLNDARLDAALERLEGHLVELA